MNQDRLVSTKFLYKRDTQVFAEIEIVSIENTYYKFVIYPTKTWIAQNPKINVNSIDSLTLPSSSISVSKTYEEQLSCLRAAIRYLSSFGPFRETPQSA